MGNRRVLILVVAVALAGLTAFLTFHYANSADERAFKDAQLVEAFVVKKDIPKGFPGERAIDEGYVGKESIPRKFFPAKGITNAQALRGQVALAPLSVGLPLVEGSFVEPRVAQESFAQRLGKGMQAVTLAISDVQGVARLVVPGDHVNLMLTADKPAAAGAGAAAPAAGDNKETQFVLQNVEVLAVGNSTTLQPGETAAQAAGDVAGQAKTVDSGLMTFAVPGLDAERVVHASESGSLHLTLVPPDYTPAPVPPVNRGNLFS
ncbi:MAG TPA: Flp pilus assembly protein CpaB [Acidimicrobiia bacterium]|nr:Flp pilus assembly protein CpaB [Acidimicrobiia bacterium]